MGFYGNITNTSRTQFQFDKIYPNRITMDNNAATDGVYIGRYVLVEYSKNFGLDQADKVYLKDGKFYTSPNFEAETEVKLNSNSYIRTDETIYYIDNEYNIKEITEVEDNTYDKNYNEDKKEYPDMGRGYDSTVWQKTFVDGVEKYVMIAELNTIVPTFDLSIDAPSKRPITPHFDADSTNVYYKLHLQPSWGFRVNEIDYNEAGFAPETISKSTEADSFTVTPVASGNLYNNVAAPDIQELSIILPSIGNSIAEMWNIVYGDKEINNGSTTRNMDIQWRDGIETTEPTGLRLININEDGYSYNEQQVNTLAGAINSVHDLMGMIIQKRKNIADEEIKSLDPNYIYYLVNDKKFYRKALKYDYKQYDGEIANNKLYVMEGTTNEHFIIGSEWNSNIKQRPEGVILGTRVEEWALKELTGFAKNYNTIHGLILRLNELLDKEDINSLLVQDLLNKFNALTPKAMLGTDELGQLTSVKLIGDTWISVDDWAQKEKGNEVNIKHIQKENNEIKTDENVEEKKLDFGSDFTISEPTITYDTAGHIDSYEIKKIKYTLPTITTLQTSVEDNKTAITTLQTSVEDNKTAITTLQTSVKNNKTSIDNLQNSVENNETNITALQTSVENNKTSINNLQTSIGNNKTSITTLQTSIENNETNINNLQTSVDGLEETLASYGDIESSIETINEIKNMNYSVDLASNKKIKSISQNAGKVSVETETITPDGILGFTPVRQGGGTGQGSNKIYIGWAADSSGLKATVDETDLGYIITNGSGTTLSIKHGGTGAIDAAGARTNLGITPANIGAAPASHNQSASTITSGTLSADRLPTIAVTKGGTGATDAATARTNLGITPANIGAAPASHNQSASTITSGTLSSDRLPTVPVAKGGTGATDAATARSNLNAQEYLGFTPIQQGGGTDQRANKIYIGWSGNQLLAQVDSTNLGNFVFGNNVSRVNLLHNGASISSGSVINIGTGAEGYKYLVTTIDSEPCIFHVTGDGGIACTKYVNNNDCFIFYGIKINSYSGGNISFGTVRLCKLDSNKLNTLDNTSVVLGPIYGII